MFLTNIFLLLAIADSVLGGPIEAHNGTSFGGPIEARRDWGCHTNNDNPGNKCEFLHFDAFYRAYDSHCHEMDGTTLSSEHKSRQTWGIYDDGGVFGIKHYFWGKWQHDRGDPVTINYKDCLVQFQQIYNNCGGWGGWINPHWGTIFGECIMQ